MGPANRYIIVIRKTVSEDLLSAWLRTIVVIIFLLVMLIAWLSGRWICQDIALRSQRVFWDLHNSLEAGQISHF